MKKVLVLLVGAALVLSLAAVSMAEVTVKGDFRYDMYDDEGRADKDGNPLDNTYGVTDLRLRFTGDLSDTVQATVNFKWVQDSETSSDATGGASIDEFKVTGKQSWGTWTMGHFEYKFTPSREELKSGGYHVWQKADALFLVNVPAGDSGFSVDAMVQPYSENKVDDGAYGVALNYGVEKWGMRLSYADFLSELSNGDGMDLMALDVHYNMNDDMLVYVAAVDYSANDEDITEYNGIDGIDPVIGFKVKNLAGVERWFASAEYAINKRYDGTDDEWTAYFLKTTYKLNNGVGLELYYCPVDEDNNKTQLRLRYQF